MKGEIMRKEAFIDGQALKEVFDTFVLIVAYAKKTHDNKYRWFSAFHYRSGYKRFDTIDEALKASAKALKYKVVS
jgi:hypothetical protein